MPVSNLSLQTLSASDVLARLQALRAAQPVKYSAFYSSQLGGIVTDPALMVIPFDDHMVHRGHGIFDTAGLVNGRREGRLVYYRVEPRGMKPLIDWITHYRAFWTERVERLELLLEEMDE